MCENVCAGMSQRVTGLRGSEKELRDENRLLIAEVERLNGVVGNMRRDCTLLASWNELKAEVERLTTENAKLIAVGEGVIAHMEGRQPVRGWLRDNNQSRDALNVLAEAVQP